MLKNPRFMIHKDYKNSCDLFYFGIGRPNRKVWKMTDRFRSFLKSLRSHKKTVLLMVITAVATLIVSTLISIWLSRIPGIEIPSLGTIRFEDIEGYWDEGLTNKTGRYISYNWGLMWPGATTNLTLYLRSLSNVDTKFVRTETDWTFYNSSNKAVLGPSDNTQFMWMTWDYDNATIHPNQVIEVTMALHTDTSSQFIEFLVTNQVQTFSFDIQISTSDHN